MEANFKSLVSAITCPGINDETARVAYFLFRFLSFTIKRHHPGCALG